VGLCDLRERRHSVGHHLTGGRNVKVC
jgi:hypothetical protein